MIIVKTTSININKLTKAEPILFCDLGAAYFYVESGIVENEMRILKNWQTAERSDNKPWVIAWNQGVQIPQELGDWLVAHQHNNQTPDKTE